MQSSITKRKYVSFILKACCSVLLLLFVLHFLSPAIFSAGAFEFEAYVKMLGHGDTVIHLPPLGKITAPTHLPPLDLNFTLKNIDLRGLSDLAGAYTAGGKLSYLFFFEQIKGDLIRYAVFIIIFAFFLGAGTSLLLSRQRINKKEIGALGLINVLFVLMLALFVAGFYNFEAFAHVEYEGIIEAAPFIFKVLENGLEVIDSLGVQVSGVVENISAIKAGMEQTARYDGDFLQVLHVSDIHNNPAALEFIGSIVETFHVQIIIDTGDLVDYGTSFEAELFANFFQGLEIPYVFIPGNHESPQVIDFLQKQERVTVLEEGTVEVAGLKIAGVADPSAYSREMAVDNDALAETAEKLLHIVQDGDPVDVVAAHNPAIFVRLKEKGRLLLGGHSHAPRIDKNEQYVEINAGSTGASGIRGVRDLEMTFSLVLLSFQRSPEQGGFDLYAADMIKIKHIPFNYSLERVLFDKQPE